MESTFIFAHLIDEWTFRCIAGMIIFILYIIFLVVGISEGKRRNKECKAEQEREEKKLQKIAYVKEHMDIFGIKD